MTQAAQTKTAPAAPAPMPAPAAPAPMPEASPAPGDASGRGARGAVVAFGLGVAALVLWVLLFAINMPHANDFFHEALPSYLLLARGHVLGFLREAPAHVCSLVLRAPFALLAKLFGARGRGVYIATALPCIAAPALLSGWLSSQRLGTISGVARLRPLDLFMLTPPVIVALHEGHPEEVLGAVLCAAAVLLALRGQSKAAGVALGFALINKPWALTVVPLTFALMPPRQRLAGIATTALVTALVMVPVLVIRMGGPEPGAAGLASGTSGMMLIPQLLWFFGRGSWPVREGHVILVLAAWAASGAWWWVCVRGRAGRPDRRSALMALALVLFLRAALDPWDNLYYFTPFMLAIMVSEDPGGFPRLSWCFVVLLVVMVPPEGPLYALGANGHAAAFGAFALATIAWLARRAFSVPAAASCGPAYAAAVSPASAA